MGRRWVVGAVLGSVLLVGVLLARPGSQAGDDDLAAPTPSPSSAVSTLPEEALVGPDALPADTTVAALELTTDRLGPLRLGEPREALEEAGWTLLEAAAGGCTRVRTSPAGDVALGGWVVDGVLASAQLELTDLAALSVPTGLGVDVGGPVEAAAGFRQRLLVVNPAAAVGGEVRTAERDVDGRTVVVSDLGTGGIRFVEVRAPAAERCRLDESVLDSTTLPTEQAVLDAVARATDVRRVGGPPVVLGEGLEQLRSGGGWERAAGLVGAGCEQVEQATDDGRSTLWLQDGTVVAQRFVSRDGEDPPPTAGRFEDVDGLLLRRTATDIEVLFPPAPQVSSRYLHVAQVVPELDTAVLVVPPTLLQQQVGVPCS